MPEAWAKPTGGAGTFRTVLASRDLSATVARGYVLYAGSDNNWHSPPCLFDDDLNNAIRFIRVERCAFACCATRQEHVNAAIDLEIDKTP